MSSDWLSKKNRYMVQYRDGMICAYCGKTCKPATQKGFTNEQQVQWMKAHYKDIATLDHVVPQSVLFTEAKTLDEFKAMVKDTTNIVCVCNECNAHKRDLSLDVWCAETGRDYEAILKVVYQRCNTQVEFTTEVYKAFRKVLNVG